MFLISTLGASSGCLQNINLEEQNYVSPHNQFFIRSCHKKLANVRVLGLRLQQRCIPCWGSSGEKQIQVSKQGRGVILCGNPLFIHLSAL